MLLACPVPVEESVVCFKSDSGESMASRGLVGFGGDIISQFGIWSGPSPRVSKLDFGSCDPWEEAKDIFCGVWPCLGLVASL